jgi:hypothetical protein
VISIALDEDVDAVKQWAVDEPPVSLTYPVLVDRDHALAESYGVFNIPTTVWIDEAGRIARPPAITPADDKFREFSNIDSSIALTALRRWVNDGVAPLPADEIRARREAPTPELQTARAERRLAMYLLRAGHADHAEAHLARALELAPNDWTIQRGSLPVRGLDPFGQEFFDFYQRYEAAGSPGYGST